MPVVSDSLASLVKSSQWDGQWSHLYQIPGDPKFWKNVVGKTSDDIADYAGKAGGSVGAAVGGEDGRRIGYAGGNLFGKVVQYFHPLSAAFATAGDISNAAIDGNNGTATGLAVGSALAFSKLGWLSKLLRSVNPSKVGKIQSAMRILGLPAASVAGEIYDSRNSQVPIHSHETDGRAEGLARAAMYGASGLGAAGSGYLLYSAIKRSRRRKSWLARALLGSAGLAGSAYVASRAYASGNQQG